MTDSNKSVERQLGELAATQKMVLQKIDCLEAKVDNLHQVIEEVQLEQAACKGGRKAADAIRGLIGGITGFVTSVITCLAMLGGFR